MLGVNGDSATGLSQQILNRVPHPLDTGVPTVTTDSG
jgi:hypothetical protein